MSENPYVPFYTSDFLGGTGGMTAATKGVYITLLCLMYEYEAPLGQSWDSLARRCGCTLPAFKKAVKELEADRKIEVTDGSIWSDKCEKHITARRERHSSAKAAAEKRWEKSKQNQSGGDATAMRPQCQPEPEPYKRDTNVSLAPSAPKKTASRGTRLKKDWRLPRDWGEWAVNEGWPPEAVRSEADKFRDYWIGLSGQRATKLDWFATWRNWIRNATPPKNHNTQRTKENGSDRAARIAAIATGHMDCGPGSDPSQPLLPAGSPDGRAGSSVGGLGQSTIPLPGEFD